MKTEFSSYLDLRAGEHLNAPITPASQRATVGARQRLKFSKTSSTVLSGTAWYDANPGESDRVRSEDRQEVRFSDAYYQWENDRWLLRFGNQQVAWGETFGTFYADVVNPKDLRLGLPLDFSESRRATPMANFKFIAEGFSAQLLHIWQPQFHILPMPGSDYSPDLTALTGASNVEVRREKQLPWFEGTGEWGGRASTTFWNTDLSLLFLEYYDRLPYYEILSSSAGRVELGEKHGRVSSSGLTLATDVEGFVVRGEAVFTKNRRVPVMLGPFLTNRSVDENAFALALDLPPWERLNVTLQWSESALSDDGNYLLREKRVTYLGLRALLSVFESSSLELVGVHSPSDAGNRLQLEFKHPLMGWLESRAGVEVNSGPDQSEFGRIKRASQAYLGLRGFWGGFK